MASAERTVGSNLNHDRVMDGTRAAVRQPIKEFGQFLLDLECDDLGFRGHSRIPGMDRVYDDVSLCYMHSMILFYQRPAECQSKLAQKQIPEPAAFGAARRRWASLADQRLGHVRLVYADSKYHNHALYRWVAEHGRLAV